MKNIIEVNIKNAADYKIAVIVSKFNSLYTEKLLDGCCKKLKEKGLADDSLTVIKVPGAFEIPMVARKLVKTGNFDAVIALGAVIRGDTYHYELVCDQVARGVQYVTLKSGIPVIFGIITTDTEEQAMDRAGGKEGNKGADAADAAFEMISVMKQLEVYE